RSLLAKLDRRCDARFVFALLQALDEPLTKFDDKALLEAAVEPLQRYMEKRHPELCPLSVSTEFDESKGHGSISAHFRPGASARPALFDATLAAGHDYEALVSIEQDLRSLGSAPYVVHADKGDPVTLQDSVQLDEYIQERARRGIAISRYK